MESPDKTRQAVRVTIFNQTYTLSAAEDPRETQALAQEIDELMSSIARRAGNLDATRTAVLACLHLADRLRTAERQLADLTGRVQDKSRNFAQLLDRMLEDVDTRG